MASIQQEHVSRTKHGHGINPEQVQWDHKDETYITTELEHNERIEESTLGNLEYKEDDKEPEIHLRTWLAVAAMTILNFVALVALTGPPTMVSRSIFHFLSRKESKTNVGYISSAPLQQTWMAKHLRLGL